MTEHASPQRCGSWASPRSTQVHAIRAQNTWRSEQVARSSIMPQVRELKEEQARAATEAARTTELREEREKLVEQVASLKDALLERKHEAAARSGDLSVCSTRLRTQTITAPLSAICGVCAPHR